MKPEQKPTKPFFERYFLKGKNITPFYWILFIFYCLLISYTALNHEQWRDEGNAWMAARDNSFFSLLTWFVPIEGHPPLYYILLFPFAKAGAPNWIVNVISVVSMALSMWIILFRVRMPFYLKLCIVFSYFFLYEYAVIGRGYCLAMLLLSLIWAVYPKRLERPWLYALLIILLFNTESLLFILAGSLLSLYFFEMIQYKKLDFQHILPVVLMAIGGGYIPIYMGSTIQRADNAMKSADHGLQASRTIEGALFMDNVPATISIVILILLALMLLKSYKALYVFLAGSLSVIYFLSYSYVGTTRHQGLLFTCILCSYVLAFYYFFAERKEAQVRTTQYLLFCGSGLLSLVLLAQNVKGFKSVHNEIMYTYSDAGNSAEFLIDHNLVQGKLLIGHTAWGGSSLMQFLPEKTHMYYASCDRYGTFLYLDSAYIATQFRYNGNFGPYTAMTKFKDSLDKVVLIMNLPITEPALLKDWKQVYSTSDITIDNQERYRIYVYKPHPKDRPAIH